jgi:glycerophosphoryl diester phosphodiesterase
MDSNDSSATDATGYLGGVADYRTTMYSSGCPKVPAHIESIELIKEWGAKFTPELKTPEVDMPYEGTYTQEDYAQQMIDEYIEAGVDQSDVWPQSFLWDDVIYWNSNTDFKQSVALVGTYEDYDISAEEFESKVADIKAAGVSYMAPPMWMLLDLDGMGKMTMSNYASLIKEDGFDIITWTLERSGPLTNGGGWYYQSITDAIDRDGNQFKLLQALHKEVEIVGIFSDWPATTTFYANCMGL